jgi:hypothetical protein
MKPNPGMPSELDAIHRQELELRLARLDEIRQKSETESERVFMG